MKYVNPQNITNAEIVEPGVKYFDWEKETYGWRLILLFTNCPSVFIECDTRDACIKKAEELKLVLI